MQIQMEKIVKLKNKHKKTNSQLANSLGGKQIEK